MIAKGMSRPKLLAPIIGIGAALLAVAAPRAETVRHLDRDIDLLCAQKQQQVSCDLRLITERGKGLVPELTVEGIELAPSSVKEFTETEAPHGAIVFLVDSSDPRRKRTVQSIARQIRTMAAATHESTLLGLAAFDKGMQLLVSPTTDRQALENASHRLEAKGKVTELFRSANEAIDLLQDLPVARRAIYIFSDGLAEDTAYDLDFIVTRAKQNNIIIYGFGYAQSASAAVGLQTLRRLSEESGGQFIEADLNAALPAEVLKRATGYILDGSTMLWDLTEIISTPGEKTSSASISISSGSRPVALELPLRLADRAPPPPEPEPPPTVVTAPTVAEEADATQEQGGSTLLLLAASIFLLLVAVALLARRALRQGGGTAAAAPTADTPAKTAYAYIQDMGTEGAEVPVDSSPWRMGRGDNNDYVIQDGSVSRHHAEISYLGANKFKITDLGASNGVLVNGRKVETADIADGDIIELGDLKFRFTLHGKGHEAEGATQFAKTQFNADD